MEIDELPDPETVAVLSAGTEVPAAADDGNLIKQAGWCGLTHEVRSWWLRKNQEHNPEAPRPPLHKVIKRQPDQYLYKNRGDRL